MDYSPWGHRESDTTAHTSPWQLLSTWGIISLRGHMLRQPRNSRLGQDSWWGEGGAKGNCVLSQEPLGGRDVW